MMTAVPDRIEKQVVLRAPLARVWSAISDSQQFGSWFGVKFTDPFKPGTRIVGSIAPTTVDSGVAAMQQPYEGIPFDITVDRIEPPTLFSFRWHPAAVDPQADYSQEAATLVVFELKEVAGGVLLTVTETGFEKIPLGRRAEAFRMNEGGWAAQMTLIEKYLAQAS